MTDLIKAAEYLEQTMQDFADMPDAKMNDCGFTRGWNSCLIPMRIRAEKALTAYRSARESEKAYIAKSLWQEYLRVDDWERGNEDEKHGAKCAIRCSATKLGVYPEFCAQDTSDDVIAARESEESTIDVRGAFMDQIEKAVSESIWIPDEYSMNDAVSDACSFLRGEVRESAGEVGVKPLKFNNIGSEWHCYSGIGLYLISPMDDGGLGLWFPTSDPEGEPDLLDDGEVPLLAAAQSDYESRIRSALT